MSCRWRGLTDTLIYIIYFVANSILKGQGRESSWKLTKRSWGHACAHSSMRSVGSQTVCRRRPFARSQVRTWLGPTAEPMCTYARACESYGHASACVCVCGRVCTHLVAGREGLGRRHWITWCGGMCSFLQTPSEPLSRHTAGGAVPPRGVRAGVTCLHLVLKCVPCSECGSSLPPRSSSVVFSSGRFPRPPEPRVVPGGCGSCGHQ